MRLLLDTNAYSALRRGHQTVAEHVRRSEEVLVSAVVAGELLFGFRNGSRYEENARELLAFLEDPNVRLLAITWETAEIFGRISASLRKQGTPIPSNDIWIAAHSMESGADLLSSDPHFRYVEGLSWQDFAPGAVQILPFQGGTHSRPGTQDQSFSGEFATARRSRAGGWR